VDECKPLVLGAVLARLRPRVVQGRAVQVDPIKPTLKAPGIKLLKLNCDKQLSSFAFKFNLRRYNKVTSFVREGAECGALTVHPAAGAYTRPLFGSTCALSVG